MGEEMKQPSGRLVYLLQGADVSPGQALADNSRRWWRRVDARKIAMLTAKDERGRFSVFLVECPDCGQLVASPRLRTEQDMEDLMDSDLADHHRCEAAERN